MEYSPSLEENENDNGNFSWTNYKIIDWNCIDVLKEMNCTVKNSKTIPLIRCVSLLTQYLHQCKHQWLPIDRIIIETQMRKAPRNVVLGYTIACFF